MRIAIIEDNAAEARDLKKLTFSLLPDTFGRTSVDVYPSATRFLDAAQYYDLLLIDCLLPDMSGMEFAKTIRKTNATTAFIFTTAYLEYAAEGYETNAMRYLLKPIDDRKLQEALLCFADNIASDSIVELTGTTRNAVYAHRSDILYVEYVGRKNVVRLADRSVESHRSIKAFERDLGTDFFYRTSPRFLVNFRHIVSKADNVLIMQNGEHVIVSGRKLTAFNQAYIQYLKRG